MILFYCIVSDLAVLSCHDNLVILFYCIVSDVAVLSCHDNLVILFYCIVCDVAVLSCHDNLVILFYCILSDVAAPSRIVIAPQVSVSNSVNDTFNCSANGYPSPTVTWIPLISGLTQPSRLGQTNGYSLLTIVDYINIQNWLCNATNMFGSTSVNILINGKFILHNYIYLLRMF